MSTEAFSDALENDILDVFFRNQAKVFASAVPWLALVTATVTEGMTGVTITEPGGGAYLRQQMTFGSVASGGVLQNTAAHTFTATGASWGTIVGIAIVDNATTSLGKLLMFDNSMTDAAIGDGDSLTFAIGAITITVT